MFFHVFQKRLELRLDLANNAIRLMIQIIIIIMIEKVSGSFIKSICHQFDFAPKTTPPKIHLLHGHVCCSLMPFLCSPSNLLPLQFLRVEQDKECNMECSGTPRKPLCASDGRTFTSRCEFLRAKCRDPQLEVIRGPCKGQVTSHAPAPLLGARRHAQGVSGETCGLNSFWHN